MQYTQVNIWYDSEKGDDDHSNSLRSARRRSEGHEGQYGVYLGGYVCPGCDL